MSRALPVALVNRVNRSTLRYSPRSDARRQPRQIGVLCGIDMADPNDPLDQLATWRTAGRDTALATVVRTWGSSPRPVGSLLAISDRG